MPRFCMDSGKLNYQIFKGIVADALSGLLALGRLNSVFCNLLHLNDGVLSHSVAADVHNRAGLNHTVHHVADGLLLAVGKLHDGSDSPRLTVENDRHHIGRLAIG